MLEVEGVGARATAASMALRDVSLAVRAGEILGVAGVAGNGQRELAEVVTGMRPARRRAGRASRADALVGGDPRAAIRAGVAHVPEDRLHTGVAPSLSIASNVVLKSYRDRELSRGPFLRLRRDPRPGRRADRALRRRRRRARDAGPPAVGRQPAEGRARPRVLGRRRGARRRLADARPRRRRDRDRARATSREAAAAGVAILLISEDLDEVLALADRIVVMYEGAIVGEVDAARGDGRASSAC